MSEITDEYIMRYLLGGATPAESHRLEELLVADQSVFDHVLTIEDELIFDYARGDLPSDTVEQFEKNFLTTRKRRERLESARAILESLSQDHELPEAGMSPSRPSMVIGGLSVGARLALVLAVAVAVISGIAFFAERLSLRREMARMEAEIARVKSTAEELRQRAERETSSREETARRLADEQARSESLEQQLNDLGILRIASFAVTLLPMRVRGPAVEMRIPPRTSVVRLTLSFDQDTYSEYQVILKKGDAVIWSRTVPASAIDAARKRARVDISADRFKTGEYFISLMGVTDSTSVEIGTRELLLQQ